MSNKVYRFYFELDSGFIDCIDFYSYEMAVKARDFF